MEGTYSNIRGPKYPVQPSLRNQRSAVDVGTHLKLLKSKLRSLSGIDERKVTDAYITASKFQTLEPQNAPVPITHRLVSPGNQSSTKSKRSSSQILKQNHNHANIERSETLAAGTILSEGSMFVETDRQEAPKLESSEIERLLRCDMCNRTFREDIIEKHSVICSKTHNANRPKFDSKSHRLAGIQAGGKPVLSAFAASSTSKPTNQNKPSIDDRILIKRPSWRDKSDQLRAAIGAARSNDPREKLHYEQELARVNKQCLTKCEYCGRSFNAEAAARHIPICQNKAQMMPKKPPGRPIEKTVAEVTSRVLAASTAVSRVPLTSSNRVITEARRSETLRRSRNFE